MLKKTSFLLATVSIFLTTVHAGVIEPTAFTNDKEFRSNSLSSKQTRFYLENYSGQLVRDLGQIFYGSLKEALNQRGKKCSGPILTEFESDLVYRQIKSNPTYLGEYLNVLRTYNYIDDIFYDILSENVKSRKIVAELLSDSKLRQPKRTFRNKKRRRVSTENHYLVKKFEFSQYINTNIELTSDCLNEDITNLINRIQLNTNAKKSDVEAYLVEAYYQGFIELNMFHFIKRILDRKVKKTISLDRYIENVLKAKNKLVPIAEKDNAKSFDISSLSDEQTKRLKHLGTREEIYKKYTATQLIMLTEVLKKASMRMGVDPDTAVNKVSINFFYEDIQTRENYVEEILLDPQSQFNLARRMLRADILNLQAMDHFRGTQVTYEDIVLASLETGYININDIAYVIKYDDLWNKKRSFWQKFKDFAFGLGGTASLFLPPPFNVIGTIGLVVAESTISKNNRNGENHVNPASYID